MSGRRAQGLLVGAFALLLVAANTGGDARVRSVFGRVELSLAPGAAWEPAREGDSLPRGATLRTGPESRAELDVDGAGVRVYEQSLARIPADPASGWRIDLERGAGSFNVRPRPDATFEVHTPSTVALAKGTSFTVTADPGGATVSVCRGLVGVREAGSLAREVLVHPGFGVTGGAGRPFALGLLDQKGDPWQAWSRGAAPSRPLERPAKSELPPASADATELVLQDADDFAIRVVAERGPRRVQIVTAEGVEVTLSKYDLHQVLRGNTVSLGSRLLATLHQRGVTPAAFAHQVLDNL